MKSEINTNILLSPRELKCLELIICGNNYNVIAKKLGIKRSTVGSFVSRIKDKFDVKTLYEVIKKASEIGII
jgi:DNA-binding NarL/FixJ family response regulator